MDQTIEKLHRDLLETGLPSTIKDLKNPTEAYVVNLLTTFLSHFGIDVSKIDQPLAEQCEAMKYFEDSDVVNLINLHTVVSQIFEQIHVPDFCLSDITSPEPKRFRNQAKFLVNFMLYSMFKKLEFNDKMKEIQTKSKLLEELKEKKTHVLKSINNIVLQKTKQMAVIEKLKADIQHTESRAEKNNKRKLKLEAMKSDVERAHQKAKELFGSVKTTAGKLSKKITDLQSEVVHSPKKYESHLDELEKEYKSKLEERDMMQEAIQDKKHSIKQIEEKLNFVGKITDDFRGLADVCKELKNKERKLSDVRKEIDSLQSMLSESKSKLPMLKSQVEIEKKLLTQDEEEYVSLCNLYSQLLSEKKTEKSKLDKCRDCFEEKCLARDKLQSDIQKVEDETEALTNYCQESFDEEIEEFQESLRLERSHGQE